MATSSDEQILEEYKCLYRSRSLAEKKNRCQYFSGHLRGPFSFASMSPDTKAPRAGAGHQGHGQGHQELWLGEGIIKGMNHLVSFQSPCFSLAVASDDWLSRTQAGMLNTDASVGSVP